ncbi:MAG TPA: CPBP family intramembrane metalloprotease [Clostridiales bacterium]|nr:CPBP family intramembrane metalloprotease [Clostridiales bacterium]
MNHVQPIGKKELIFGLIFLPIYIFVLPVAIGYASLDFFEFFKISPSAAHVTLLYYFVSLIFILIILGSFLKESFFAFFGRLGSSLHATFMGYMIYVALLYAVSILISILIIQQTPNPNNEAVQNLLQQNSRAMMMSSLLLAPIVEETLFRGLVFAPLLKVNRIAAYALSFLIFAFYHIWQYVLSGLTPQFFIYLLQYLPGSIVLSWSYEKSGTIWSPILLHALINAAAIRSF